MKEKLALACLRDHNIRGCSIPWWRGICEGYELYSHRLGRRRFRNAGNEATAASMRASAHFQVGGCQKRDCASVSIFAELVGATGGLASTGTW